MYCLLVEEEEDFSWRRRRRTREEILRSDQGRELAKLFIALARQVGGDPRPCWGQGEERRGKREGRREGGGGILKTRMILPVFAPPFFHPLLSLSRALTVSLPRSLSLALSLS